MSFDEAVEEFNNTVGLDKGIIVEAYSKNSVSELADSVVASVKKDSGAETPPNIFPTAKSTEVMMLNSTDWQPFADATGVTTDDLTPDVEND